MGSADGTTKAARLAQEFRRRIMSGEFARDSWLRQDELAAQFSVSITPVREALRMLSAENLVVLEPHRGVRVVGANIERIVAAYVVRRLTESFAMRRAVYRLSRRDLDVLAGMLDASPEDDPRDETHADPQARNHAFHFYFYERCGMPDLRATIAQMWDAFPWDLMLSSPDRSRQSEREHRAILEAAAAGNADLAAERLSAHLASGLRAIELHLSPDGVVADPFEEH